ncbi:CHAT domain-containing protein [Variovorax robiniae]|uniref:CHAT domain-containing protein n=1 Tax=Variovorax robiniae TaxID=1836199 RepID=A0ABU8XJG2_9BURK
MADRGDKTNSSHGEIHFVVPGTELTGSARSARAGAGLTGSTSEHGEVKQAVRVGMRRDGGSDVTLTARPGEDVVEIAIANGPTLVLHPQDALELLRAQRGGVPPQKRDGSGPALNVVNVSSQLAWQGLEDSEGTTTRSGLLQSMGGVVLDTIRVVRRVMGGKASTVTAEAISALVDSQVDAGIYKLSLQPLTSLKGSLSKIAGRIDAPAGAPSLVLIHGTISSTEGTFAKLWQLHPTRVEKLFGHYGGRVYALDHPTLAASPFANALTLLRQVPDNAELHLLTHSRGGVVAEVVARIVGGQGLDADSMALFADTDDANYTRHREELVELKNHASRGIRVTRMVRVACPARGTLLASRRLDAYLSVFRWALELAGLTVTPKVVEFLGAVAAERLKPDVLPGLQAMVPDSPTTQWLTQPADEPLKGELRVVAGDIEGDSVLSWLKTLLTDAFYWTDHDLVVQTRSMYGGAPRGENGASFVLDRGAKVSHFRYFENELTAAAIVDGLVAKAPPVGYRPIGPLSWAGKDTTGDRAGKPVHNPALPAIFVLPGILGSHLAVSGKRIWLSWRFVNQLDRIAYPGPATPDGAIGATYDALIAHLSGTHDVHEFSFDWRRPIEEEARRLGDEVLDALEARKGSGQAVRFIAHSMGGVVARTLQLERPEVWEAVFRHPDARLLMLGTPNGGSYAPMQVLSGDDTFGNLLSSFGSLFDGHEARQLIAGMPGLLQLQADLMHEKLRLNDPAGWVALQKADLDAVDRRIEAQSWWHRDLLQKKPLQWGLPDQKTLTRAVALRQRLDKQSEALPNVEQVLLVVGQAKSTPTGVRIADDGVQYLNAIDGGDGRVTLDRAMLPRVKTWQAPGAHGRLPALEGCFDAYVELLDKGDTDKLSLIGAGTRAAAGAPGAPAAAVEATRATHGGRHGEPPETAESVFRSGGDAPPPATAQPGRLTVRIVNGDLRLLAGPLLMGHYRSFDLTGAESVANRLLGGSMDKALRTGAYPSNIGAAQVFNNTYRRPDDPSLLPRPSAVVVVGLGEEGELNLTALSDTVRLGVLAYAQRVAEQRDAGTVFDLSAVLMGSGGSSMPVATSAQAIALGVQQANQRLAAVGWPQVRALQLVDRYLDRAADALQALRSLSSALAQDLDLAPLIRRGAGALRRLPEAGYRGVDYDFIAVGQGNEQSPLRFTLDTRRARSEVTGVRTQSGLVRTLIEEGAFNGGGRDTKTGRSLFQLMVPVEIEPFLAESNQALLQLDHYSAQYPWELLDTSPLEERAAGDRRPWALRSRLLRKLRTEDFREAPKYAGHNGAVLVIGEPLCDPDRYGPLPAAQREGRQVAAAFTEAATGDNGKAQNVTLLLQRDAADVTNAAFNDNYRVIHIAGHGDFRKVKRDDGEHTVGGIVLSGDLFFGPDEVRAMRRVPDLVFINCCHIGRMEGKALQGRREFARNTPKFAASVAEALIEMGVRCVVAAGWAVGDAPAAAFARRFYDELLAGEPFVTAVNRAREQIWGQFPDSNTWAAYQCYGDPGWRLVEGPKATGSNATPPVHSAEGLILRLQAHAQELQYGDDAGKERSKAEVQQLDTSYGDTWQASGEVCAAFGAAYAEDSMSDRAILWYQRACRAEDGGGSVKALQQLGNLKARAGEKLGDREAVMDAISLLDHAFALARSSEGASLLGSAWKRLAKLDEKAGAKPSSRQVRVTLQTARQHYFAAEQIARESKADDLFYPLVNRILIDMRLGTSVPKVDLDKARACYEAKLDRDPDFWAAVGSRVELDMYAAFAERRLSRVIKVLKDEIKDLRLHTTSRRLWDSVSTQAEFVLLPCWKDPTYPAAEREAIADILEALGSAAIRALALASKPVKRGAARKRTQPPTPLAPVAAYSRKAATKTPVKTAARAAKTRKGR